MPATSEQLWDAIYRIGIEDVTADKIQPVVIAKRIEFKMAELSAIGLPQLTAYGEKWRRHVARISPDSATRWSFM